MELSELLKANDIVIPKPCGECRKCGKCKIILDGAVIPAFIDITVEKGQHLIEYNPAQKGQILEGEKWEILPSTPERGCGVAVDLGTTTIVIKIFDLETGEQKHQYSAWNAQRVYGADVISRIDYINNNNALDELSNVIRKQVEDAISGYEVKKIFISGNTVMQHIFAGINPHSIAIAPFKPESLFEDYEDDLNGIPITYSPCVSGYVGGDITAGILAAGLNEEEGKSLFLDIGTNGEMAIGGKDGFICCAVASGPAFEGAGISCGMPGLVGAISHASIEDGEIVLETIGDGEAEGICGSGLIDLLSVLKQMGKMDETGRLSENDVKFTDRVSLTQADVRELQLAKAAVRAGIAVLMNEIKVSFEDIKKLYICGGFGTYLDAKSAAEIDMIPIELEDRCVQLGNTSLKGASLALMRDEELGKLHLIADKCQYLELSGNAMFDDEFVEHMILGEDT